MTRVFTFGRVTKIGLLAGCISASVMLIFWNIVGRVLVQFVDLAYVKGLLFGTSYFSVSSVFFYSLQNFIGAFILSFLYFLGMKYINKHQNWGVFFYVLFACFGFVFFVTWSLAIANDIHGLLALFMMDDLFQSLFITLPITMLAPRGRRSLFDS